MSAIKLPVKAIPDRSDRWQLSDSKGDPVAMYLRPDHAVEIAIALNLHDNLVDSLRVILPMAKGYAAAHPVGNNAQMVVAAVNVLARAENQTKT